MPTHLLATGTASPALRYSQADCLAHFEARPQLPLNNRSRRLLELVLTGESGIDHRHSAITPADLEDWSAERASRLYEQHAPDLAAAALAAALEKLDLAADELDALLLCTCTGALCPGPSTHLAERLGCRADIHLGDLTGFGCAAAVPTLHQAAAFLALHPDALVAVVAVELCSATYFVDDDPAQLISLCLFGDGAAALLLAGDKHPARHRSCGTFSRFRSRLMAAERESIRMAPAPGGMLRNQLDLRVPELAAEAVGQLWEAERREHGDEAEPRILSHGGGRKVIEALQERIPGQDFAEAAEVLRHHGNLSSPSLFFALDLALQAEPPPSGWWLTGFGAGFSAHACRLEPV